MVQTILLVEDRPNIIDLVITPLVAQGYHVSLASDTAAGFEQITHNAPDLLILGLALPDVFEMLQQIRAGPNLSRLPVITILKLSDQNADVQRGWELEVDAFLPSVFNPVEMVAFVKRILKSTEEDR